MMACGCGKWRAPRTVVFLFNTYSIGDELPAATSTPIAFECPACRRRVTSRCAAPHLAPAGKGAA